MSEPAFPDALPLQYRLHWYVVERVLGQGGFGITYLARDSNLDQSVAIKEYLPSDIATRRPDATIRSRTDEHRERYRWGLDRFIKEARTLARFDHPNIVRVHSVFEANNTAYMVMRFEAGETLSAVLESRGTLSEEELLRIMLPVLDGLTLVHEAGFVHRDIKPDNIHIRTDGSPVLLDFGSARPATGKPHTLTILVAPGYAPFEQYYGNSEAQGPWTDIYGLGATCYRAIAGRAPLDAISRSKGILGNTRDVMVPASVVGAGRYSGRLLAAIDHALAFGEKDRPQTVAEWRKELTGDGEAPSTVRLPAQTVLTQRGASAPTVTAATQSVSDAPTVKEAGSRGGVAWSIGRWRGWMTWTIGGLIVLAVVLAGESYIAKLRTPAQKPNDPTIALQEKIDKLEQQLMAQQQQRAEAERKRQEAAEAERKRQEAAEAERKRQEAERLAAEGKKQEAERLEAERKRQEAERAAAERARLAEAARQRDAAERARLQREQAEAERKAKLAAPQPAPVPPRVVEPKPAPPSPAELLARADRALNDRDYAAAVAVLRPLAQGGNANAQFRLGTLYAAGRGVAQSDDTAVMWYQRAAEQGEPDAQASLADAYASGRGVPANNYLAYVWSSLAVRAGSTRGRGVREKASALLQPAEVRQADALVESWKPAPNR